MSIGIKINCVYNKDGTFCTNKNVKRTLFGIGPRLCCDYPCYDDCLVKEQYPRPSGPPIGICQKDHCSANAEDCRLIAEKEQKEFSGVDFPELAAMDETGLF